MKELYVDTIPGDSPGGQIPEGYDTIICESKTIQEHRCPRCNDKLMDKRFTCSCGRVWQGNNVSGYFILVPFENHPDYKNAYKCQSCGERVHSSLMDNHGLQNPGHTGWDYIYEDEDWNIHFEIRETWNYGPMGANEYYLSIRRNKEEVETYIRDFVETWKGNIRDAGDKITSIKTDYLTNAKILVLMGGVKASYGLKVIQKEGKKENVNTDEVDNKFREIEYPEIPEDGDDDE